LPNFDFSLSFRRQILRTFLNKVNIGIYIRMLDFIEKRKREHGVSVDDNVDAREFSLGKFAGLVPCRSGQFALDHGFNEFEYPWEYTYVPETNCSEGSLFEKDDGNHHEETNAR
jgi:hypothetical protein